MSKKIIGILGGMGPAATMDMFQKFIQLTPATCDQEHIPLLISSIPDIPDRTTCILHNGANPGPILIEQAKRLESAGANCIIIACNTAHNWFDEIHKQVNVEMISMIESTADAAVSTGKKRIGILATDATLETGLYKKKIEEFNLDYIAPDPDSQTQVMHSIYLYKAGKIAESTEIMMKQKDALIKKGAEIIILGCTEVPMILMTDINISPELYVDSTLCLVKSAINWYRM
ncbi:aspartate/glutamate racemase family protein [Pasteurella bettyae]|uniref:aspartate/glutamate racemase family protein n=1 Tax=Pasteurella bettyae TaxID=752 RepID=UPI003D2AFC92